MFGKLGFFGAAAALSLGVAACGGSVQSGGTGGNGGSAGNGGSGGAAGSAGGSAGMGGAGAGGGSAGSAGSAGAGGAGGDGSTPQCTDASQCKLVEDCCHCVGLPGAEAEPTCENDNCKQSMCGVLAGGVMGPQCEAGQCVAGFVCDPALVVCNGLPPDCPAGQTAAVAMNGCWGQCVPVTECATVGSCDQCGDLACVKEETQLGVFVHCVKAPAACNGTPSCECMGESVCVGSTKSCMDGADGALVCFCPNC